MAHPPNHQHSTLQQLMSGGVSRGLSSVSEDGKILKEIQASHAHDARDLDVTPVLSVILDIFQRAKLDDIVNTTEGGGKEVVADVLAETMGSVAAGPKGTMLEALAVTIQKICCEFSCNCTGNDLHASTLSVLNLVGNYSWDAKVVVTLAAFAVTYGELWLVILLSLSNNPLAKSIAVLKQTPELSEINGVLKPQLATLNALLTVVVDVAKLLIEFRTLPSKYITPEDAPLATSTNQIAIAAYWSVRSVVACGARITSNIGITSGLVGSATEAWDLSSLVHKGRSVHDQLRQKLTVCYEFIELRKKEEAYKNLEILFQSTQITDNVKIIKSLIYPKDDLAPLVKVTTRQRVHFDVLRGKTVLLFISDLDVNIEELATLDRIYKESRKNESEFQYEIVWLPIVDKNVPWTKENEQKFKELQYKMSWYTLFHPSLLDEVATRFVKEKWGFAKKQILVSLNQLGKVVSQNALHMMLIWGNSAYPFTTVKEEEMWTKQTWKIDFLLDGIHPEVPKWLSEKVHICAFGGEDIEWIRKFTTSMKEHATKTGTKIELLYVGKHNAKEAVKKIIDIITKEKLAHTTTDVTQVWYFWTRLEAMLYSKMHHGKNVENDTIVKEVMSVLSFDGGHQGWGCVGMTGSTEIVKGNGQVILNAVVNYREWEEKSKKVGFLEAFLEHVRVQFNAGHHCNRVELPSVAGAGAPSVVYCADCHRPMEKFYLYKCCTG
ncbi:protein SIEVE ELEMENT OCCLUSION B-like [Silene latifolia]|uniref:protein SIEVE ELEMENT OCCLUSION B-like n=1 Tax=Silene latifolia TaxID=37657 RepID=UPI003D76B33B